MHDRVALIKLGRETRQIVRAVLGHARNRSDSDVEGKSESRDLDCYVAARCYSKRNVPQVFGCNPASLGRSDMSAVFRFAQ